MTKPLDVNIKKNNTLNDIFDQSSSERLKERGIYYITGDIDLDSLLEIHQDILCKDLDPLWNDDVQLVINSPGGYCSEAWALVDLLNYVKMDVRTIGMGECSSMGAILLACGTKGKRIITKHCTVMIHKHSMGMFGKHDELISSFKSSELEYKKHEDFWLQASKYTKKTDILGKLLLNVDNYLSAEDALTHGIIDRIQENKKIIKPSLLNKKTPIKKKSKVKKKSPIRRK